MRFPPPEVIATWPPPNYSNPVTRGPALMIVELTICPLALLCLVLRLYVRIYIVNRAGWDDWLMIASAICGCGVTICVILATQLYGWDIHVWDLTFDTMENGRKISLAGQTIFLFASGLAKTSVLISYFRIALRGSLFWKLTWATLVTVVALMFIFLIVLYTQCFPTSSYWDLFANNRDCSAEGPPLMGQTITTVLTDFVVYALPIPTLYSLNMPRKQRVLLMFLFGLGSVVVVAGCMRAYWVWYVVDVSYDPTWDGSMLWIWTAVEVNLGVICASAPMLKPLFGRWLGDTISKGNSSSSRSGRSGGRSGGGGGGNSGGHERLALQTIGGSKFDAHGVPIRSLGTIRKTIDVEMDRIPLRGQDSISKLSCYYCPGGPEPDVPSREKGPNDMGHQFSLHGGSSSSMV